MCKMQRTPVARDGTQHKRRHMRSCWLHDMFTRPTKVVICGVSGEVSRQVKVGLGELPEGGGGVCKSNEHKRKHMRFCWIHDVFTQATTVATCGVSGEVSRQVKVGLGELPEGWRGVHMPRCLMNHVSNKCTYHIHVARTMHTCSWYYAWQPHRCKRKHCHDQTCGVSGGCPGR